MEKSGESTKKSDASVLVDNLVGFGSFFLIVGLSIIGIARFVYYGGRPLLEAIGGSILFLAVILMMPILTSWEHRRREGKLRAYLVTALKCAALACAFVVLVCGFLFFCYIYVVLPGLEK